MPAMSKRTKVYGFLILLVVLAGAGYFLKPRPETPAASAKESPSGSGGGENGAAAAPVELAQARRDRITHQLSSTSNLRPLREVEVKAQTEGIVRSLLVEEGDLVRQGQLLGRLDDRSLRIQLELSREKLAQAKLQLEKARIRREKAKVQIANTENERQRLQEAYEEQLISEREYDQVRYQLEELGHDERVSASETRELFHRVQELEAEIRKSELEISHTRITAPFDGRITERTMELGKSIRSTDKLFKLGAFSPLYADVFLSEREARRVRPGQKASVRLGADEALEGVGRVVRVSPVVDTSSGTVKVTVELTPAPGGFMPGGFVRVAIQTDVRPDAILVPKRAVLERDGKAFVFLAANGVARRVPVQLGYEEDGNIEILQGISAGDRVVVAGQGALEDGSEIRKVGEESSNGLAEGTT
jgi:membrane fusion protein (multidrug efflux system)